MNPVHLSRRTVLRGVGTALALPLLEAMVPLSALAQSGGAAARTKRLAFLFVPNGINMADWTPTTTGTNYELKYITEPLAPFRNKLNILSGLTQANAFALGDGGGDHARSASAWLTGCHPRKTSGADIKVGISTDQLAAQKIGDLTRFPSLEIGCERGGLAGDCDSGYSCAYSNSISWRGESTPVAKETDPRLVFERLFGAGEAEDQAESRELRASYNKSILDFVIDDAKSLSRKLGAHDQAKLDEYFTGVREIERRLEWVAKQRQDKDSTLPVPAAVNAPQDYAEHIRLMGDMMVLAFQGDLTRISTFMFANEGSNRPYKLIGVNDGHHDMSHHGRDPEKLDKVKKINRFHVEQLAYILKRMDSIKEGNGTLLDNTMLVYGAGICDGDRHNHDDLPILVAGSGAGTIKTGRHIAYQNGTPMTNLSLSLLDRIGVPAETLGDSTGRLNQLF
jgi:hypothetical protein